MLVDTLVLDVIGLRLHRYEIHDFSTQVFLATHNIRFPISVNGGCGLSECKRLGFFI